MIKAIAPFLAALLLAGSAQADDLVEHRSPTPAQAAWFRRATSQILSGAVQPPTSGRSSVRSDDHAAAARTRR